ncbi:MAG: hypothetical protein KatS3mg081_1946 [Gemmatimonadales bacterium]|nr:MAG: hypothetical protein KatS3mg081_1946 [Gemmatimonadales bacterium]
MGARLTFEILHQARQLAEAGKYAALLSYCQSLGEDLLRLSPTLALLKGIAAVRLGFPEEGRRWAKLAFERARERGDRTIEIRALNALGGINLATGLTREAEDCFALALGQAYVVRDHATVGRCCNNLGILANLRGSRAQAVGWHTRAVAAFERVGSHRGVAEALHNLAHVYKDEGDWERASDTAAQAIQAAELSGDLSLVAATICGYADVQRLAGDPLFAAREVEKAIALHRELGDVMGEAEDLRVLAGALGAQGEYARAEALYREVIRRAEQGGDELMAAEAERDLAALLWSLGREAEGRETASRSRARFSKMAAFAEVRRLDQMLSGGSAAGFGFVGALVSAEAGSGGSG